MKIFGVAIFKDKDSISLLSESVHYYQFCNYTYLRSTKERSQLSVWYHKIAFGKYMPSEYTSHLLLRNRHDSAHYKTKTYAIYNRKISRIHQLHNIYSSQNITNIIASFDKITSMYSPHMWTNAVYPSYINLQNKNFSPGFPYLFHVDDCKQRWKRKHR